MRSFIICYVLCYLKISISGRSLNVRLYNKFSKYSSEKERITLKHGSVSSAVNLLMETGLLHDIQNASVFSGVDIYHQKFQTIAILYKFPSSTYANQGTGSGEV